MKTASTADEFRDRIDELMQKVAPNDVVAWLDAMSIVGDAWRAGHQRGCELALETMRNIDRELELTETKLRAGK